MTQLGVKCPIYGPKTREECAWCSMHEHPCEYPSDFLAAILSDEEDFERTEFTPSSLLECKRRVVMRTSNDYYVDPQQRWKMLRGEAVHMLFEKKGKYPPESVVDVLREVRLKTYVETRYGPQLFSGKSDAITILSIENGRAHIKITDYKTTKLDYKKDGFSEDHEWSFRENQMQLNMYAWLAQKELPRIYKSMDGGKYFSEHFFDRVVVDELELTFVGWDSMRRFTSKGQLVTRGKLANRATWEYEPLPLAQIHILPFETTEKFIISTIEEMIENKSAPELPPLLEGKKAQVVCPACPLKEVCFGLAGR